MAWEVNVARPTGMFRGCSPSQLLRRPEIKDRLGIDGAIPVAR